MNQTKNQPYDSSLKALIRAQLSGMLPHLLPAARLRLLEAIETDILKPQAPLRADKVFKVDCEGKLHILHMELEVRGRKKTPRRMLSYHSLLLEAYNVPVISVVIYPFKTTLPVAPFVEKSGKRVILTFDFHPIALWTFEAEKYVEEHVIDMYPLLPTMHGAKATLLIQAMHEMKQQYDDTTEFSNRILWFRTLLARVETLPLEEKLKVEREINMFEQLLDEDPSIKARVKRAALEEREKIAAEQAAEAAKQAAQRAAEIAAERAALQELQTTMMQIIQRHFPSLTDLAQQRIAQVDSSSSLRHLVELVSAAPDEYIARFVLDHTSF